MSGKKISSEFDRKVVDVLNSIVSGQSMKLEDGEGHTWQSEAETLDDGELTKTIIKRDDEVVARIIHDHETSEEKTFYY